MKQKTIKKAIHLEGVGIHSGKPSKIIVYPASEGIGICFSYQGNLIPARIENITGDYLAATLDKIVLVEHLLAAAKGLEISNLLIECFASEIPILDGSSRPFVEEFEECGIIEQEKDVEAIILKSPVRVDNNDSYILAEPSNAFEIDFEVDYPVIGKQVFHFNGSKESFVKDIAPARTFGYEKDLEELKKNGFAQGANQKNALGISEKGYVNTPRFKDEPVRHKILDLMGDLALLGRPVNAKIKAYKSSHCLNHDLIRRILHV